MFNEYLHPRVLRVFNRKTVGENITFELRDSFLIRWIIAQDRVRMIIDAQTDRNFVKKK